MNLRFKRVALRLLPPVLAEFLKWSRDRLMGGPRIRRGPAWEMVADSDEIWTANEGWSHSSIAQTQRKKWPAFLSSVEGARPLGQSHEGSPDAPADVGPHNTIMSFAYALGRAAVGRSGVSVLDWGGGAGHYYVYARKLYPELQLDFVIRDLPSLCDVGRELLPEVTYVSDDRQALSRHYDFVFASSSLHYTRDFYGLLGRLCDSAVQWLMVTRLPVLQRHVDFVVMQRPHMFGYMTEYPGWFVNRKRLMGFMTERRFSLDREFLVSERPYVPNAPEQAQYAGFLFRRIDEQGSKAAPRHQNDS